MHVSINAQNKPIKVFADTGIIVTGKMLDKESKKWGGFIKRKGIKHLGLCMGNRPEFLYAFAGAMLVGVPVVLVPTVGNIEVPECTILFDDKDKHITRRDGLALSEVIQDIVASDGETIDKPYEWNEFDTIVFAPSSGTSGKRKWMEKSWTSYIGKVELLLYKFAAALPFRIYNASPWYHNIGMYMLMSVISGNNIMEITAGTFNPLKTAEALKKYRPTIWLGTPSMLYRSCIVTENDNYVPSILMFGGEKLTSAMMNSFSKSDSFKIAFSGYATTETGDISNLACRKSKSSLFTSFICLLVRVSGYTKYVCDVSDFKDGFAGELIHGVSVKIKDSDDNGVGSILVRTSTMAENIDGFYDTGDLGYMKGNCLYLTGRRNSVINHSGEKIITSEIEDIILKLPGVKDVVAFGMPSKTHGEDLFVAVAGDINDEEIFKVLPSFQRPRKVLFLNSIPLNESGKKDIKKLQRLYSDGE